MLIEELLKLRLYYNRESTGGRFLTRDTFRLLEDSTNKKA